MANSFYQTLLKPRLYVSYPLWQYANDGLSQVFPERLWWGYDHQNQPPAGDHWKTYQGLKRQELINLIKLDPANASRFDLSSEDNYYDYDYVSLGWNVVDRPTHRILLEDLDSLYHPTGDLPPNLWNFNYGMILNHNLASAGAYYKFRNNTGQWNDVEYVGGSDVAHLVDIINSPQYAVPEYDGFSVNILRETMAEDTDLGMSLEIHPEGDDFLEDVQLGSVLWGRYFDFPHNTELQTSLSYQYDKKSVKNISGDTISTAKWNKVDGWYNTTTGGTEPFGLRKPIAESIIDHDAYLEHDLHDTANSHRRKSGARVWNISFNSLSQQSVMNQNPMMNDYLWDSSVDNSEYATFDDGSSEHDIDSATDFYTNVVHKTNGGSLPMVMQIDKDDNSPQNFVIVKMSDYTITQTSPNLYSIKLTLEEQV